MGNVRFRDVELMRSTVKKVLEGQCKKVKTDAKNWFCNRDSQGEFSRGYLSSKKEDDNGDSTLPTDFKSYKYLKNKFELTDEDVRLYSKDTLIAHLKQKKSKRGEKNEESLEIEKNLDPFLMEIEVEAC